MYKIIQLVTRIVARVIISFQSIRNDKKTEQENRVELWKYWTRSDKALSRLKGVFSSRLPKNSNQEKIESFVRSSIDPQRISCVSKEGTVDTMEMIFPANE